MPGSSYGRLMIAPPDLRDLAPRGGCESAATPTDGEVREVDVAVGRAPEADRQAHPVPERDESSLLVLSIRD